MPLCPEEGRYAVTCTTACQPRGFCSLLAGGSTGQWCLDKGKTRMCHWVLPKPQQETVLAAKGWQPSLSCLRAWIGVVHH